jgi:hypothetical protein
MTGKRKVKRSAKRPAARQRAARRRALSKRVPQERLAGDGSAAPADDATVSDATVSDATVAGAPDAAVEDPTHFDDLMALCGFIGLSVVARAMCVLERNWDWVMEDADPDEPLEDIFDELGDDGVLIRAVLGTAMRHQELIDPKEPGTMMSDVLDQLDELHAMVHDGGSA